MRVYVKARNNGAEFNKSDVEKIEDLIFEFKITLEHGIVFFISKKELIANYQTIEVWP